MSAKIVDQALCFRAHGVLGFRSVGLELETPNYLHSGLHAGRVPASGWNPRCLAECAL